jgi:hypothetical protein
MPGYGLYASPTLYPGQTIRARLSAAANNQHPLHCQLILQIYGANDQLVEVAGPAATLSAGQEQIFTWQVPDQGGCPITRVGFSIQGTPYGSGQLFLDYLTWDGEPETHFRRPIGGGQLWYQAWVNAVDHHEPWYTETYRLVKDEGLGMLIQGTREWRNYQMQAVATPHLASSFGIAARVQGLNRYVAILLTRDGSGQGQAQLLACIGNVVAQQSQPCDWQLYQNYPFSLKVVGQQATAQVGDLQLHLSIPSELSDGGIAMLCEQGRVGFEEVQVAPAAS